MEQKNVHKKLAQTELHSLIRFNARSVWWIGPKARFRRPYPYPPYPIDLGLPDLAHGKRSKRPA